MARPYSYDLRSRAINLINSSKSRKFVSDLLLVSVPTIDRWISRYKETSDVKPKNDIKTGRKRKINDIKKFSKFVEKNKHLSLTEMQHKWKKASFMTIYRNINLLGYSYKKNSGYIKKGMKSKDSNS